MKKANLQRLLCLALTLLLVISVLPAQILAAEPETQTFTKAVTTTDTSASFEYSFTAGQAYKVTAAWASDPSFTGSPKGWSLTTGSTAADGDLVFKASTGSASSSPDKVAKSVTTIFTAAVDATSLYLDAAGISADNSLTVKIEPATAEDGLLVDMTVTIPAQTRYTNFYSDAAFKANTKYDYSVQWTNQPTHSANDVRAWKIQPAASSSVDGSGGDWYVGPKSANGVSDQTASGTQTSTVDRPVFNLFTQYVKDENTVHITIKKYTEPAPAPSAYSPLNEKISVAVDESKFFQYDFKSGKTYRITASWDSAPSFSGSLSGWQLQTVSDAETAAAGDVVVKLAKKGSDNTAAISHFYQGTFTPTQDMGALKLSPTAMTAANSVTVQIEEVTLDKDVVFEGTFALNEDVPWLHTWSGVNLDTNAYYKFTVSYAAAPAYTGENQDKTAWKLHVTDQIASASTGYLVYTNTASSNTAAQSYTTVGKPSASGYISFFTQRTAGTNTVTIKIENADESDVKMPYGVLDEVSIVKTYNVAGNANGLCAKAGCTESHPMQAFDVYDGILFVTYDGGYVMTYDLETGEKLSGFLMECGEYSHEHHCGNAMFGTAKYDESDRFPLFYSSGDLSTKACYVERILTDENGIPVDSEMVQLITFDMGEYAGANGAQAVVDPANSRIIYQQRKQNSISLVNNAFVMGEYPLPACTEGTDSGAGYKIVSYSVEDLLVPAYELPYWSPMYQGADYFENQLLQTHGPTTNAFGSQTGLMVFDYTTTGHNFSRYINLCRLIGTYEPQGVSICSNKLYISYFDTGVHIYEMEVVLGIKETGYDLTAATDISAIQSFVADEVTKQLTQGGKGYTLQAVSVKSTSATGFTADVTVKTPYTVQTVTVSGSGTILDHSFTNYISDGNATCNADGTKTAVCDNPGCSEKHTAADPGSKLEHSFTNYVSDNNASCTADGTKTAVCGNPGCSETHTVTDTGSALGHKLVKTAAKAATTEAEGNIEFYTCQRCGKLYSDQTASKELTEAETVLKKLDQNTQDPTTAPTEKPSNNSPATGEPFPIALAAAVMAASLLALVLTLRKRRA